MTVIDQIKILDRKIKQNKAQYDLDRKVAKIFALSSNNLDKYEYLTDEDLGLKPSTVEQAKFDYSPLGKVFNKGLNKDDKKEGLLKRLQNIKDKNKELLNAFSTKAPKSESNYNYDSECAFYGFYRDFKKFNRTSLPSKYDEMSNFHKLLNAFINTHKGTNIKTEDCKDKVIKNVKLLYNDFNDLNMSLREYNFIVNNINQKPSIVKTKMSNVKNIPYKTYSNTPKRSIGKRYLIL